MPKRSRFTDEQIVATLREVESGKSARQTVCKRMGVTETTFFRWKKRFGSMDAPDAKRLRELEAENRRLKKLLAERDLAIDVMKEINSKKW